MVAVDGGEPRGSEKTPGHSRRHDLDGVGCSCWSTVPIFDTISIRSKVGGLRVSSCNSSSVCREQIA